MNLFGFTIHSNFFAVTSYSRQKSSIDLHHTSAHCIFAMKSCDSKFEFQTSASPSQLSRSNLHCDWTMDTRPKIFVNIMFISPSRIRPYSGSFIHFMIFSSYQRSIVWLIIESVIMQMLQFNLSLASDVKRQMMLSSSASTLQPYSFPANKKWSIRGASKKNVHCVSILISKF